MKMQHFNFYGQFLTLKIERMTSLDDDSTKTIALSEETGQMTLEQLILKRKDYEKELRDIMVYKYAVEHKRAEIIKLIALKCKHQMVTDCRYHDEHTVYKCSICGLNNFDIFSHNMSC